MKHKCLNLLVILALLLGINSANAFYNPGTGKWLSRDPMGEAEGKNLSGFVRGDPISFFDKLGLAACCCIPGAYLPLEIKGQQLALGVKPDDNKWVDVVDELSKEAKCLEPISNAVDKAKKAWAGFLTLYLSAGYPFNYYVEIKYRCCRKSGGWGSSRTIGPEKVAGDDGDGDYSFRTQQAGTTDFIRDLYATLDSLVAQAQAICERSAKGSPTK